MCYMQTIDLEWASELAMFLFSLLPSKILEEMGMGGKQLKLKNSNDSDLPDITDTFDVPGTVQVISHLSSHLFFTRTLEEYYQSHFIHEETKAQKS